MPIGFGLNQPTDIDRIFAAIAPYATQEAAESDFMRAPQGRNYLYQQYQRLTGDMNADPFADTFKMKQAYRQAQEDAAVAALQPGQAGSAFPANVSMSGARTIARDLQMKAAQEAGEQYQLSSSRLQVTPDNDANRASIINERANRLGVGSLLRDIVSRNPQLLNAGAPTDEFFGMGKSAKKAGVDVMNPGFLTPEFREAYARDPNAARKLYTAVTGRASLENDITAQREHYAAQKGERQKLLGSLEGLQENPLTHSLTRQVKVSDGMGGVKMVEVPLTPYETEVYKTEQGQMPTGVQVPGHGTIPELEGRTPEELDTTNKLFNRNKQANPRMSDQEVMAMTISQLRNAEQKIAGRKTATPTGPQGPKDILGFLSQIDPNDPYRFGANSVIQALNAIKSVPNLVPRAFNKGVAIGGGNRFMPMIPDIPTLSYGGNGQDFRRRADEAEVIRQLLGL